MYGKICAMKCDVNARLNLKFKFTNKDQNQKMNCQNICFHLKTTYREMINVQIVTQFISTRQNKTN